MDNIIKRWGAYNSYLQRGTRKYWDPTYTLAEGHIDKTAGYAYDYCYNLTIGGVAKGTWYLPTLEQLYAIWGIYKIKDNSSYAYYSAFHSYLLSSTEENTSEARGLNISSGYGYNLEKYTNYGVRCVRDLPSDDLSAQTVITVSGYPVIDLSTLHPLGAVLSYEAASARRTLMNQQTPSNSAYLSVGEKVSDDKGTWNAQMSGKFQVMRANHSEAPIDWASAYNLCKNYKGEGGGAGQWRLPTSRELMMTWVLHPQLIGKGGFTAFLANNGYWSLTEFETEGAYFLNTSTASRSYGFENKTTNYSVRCVRDL